MKSISENYSMAFTEKEEASSFRQLAQEFFMKNFGEMQKSDIELLMFSIYLDKLYEKYPKTKYDDFTISKELGISPRRVALLKQKKELKYPTPKFNWKQVFAESLKLATYENGKVKIYIKDIRLYNELLEILYSMNAYSEGSLTPQLLTISVPAFLDLVIDADSEKTPDEIKKQIYDVLKKNSEYDIKSLLSIKDLAKEQGNHILNEILPTIISTVPIFGEQLSNSIRPIITRIQADVLNHKEEKNED